MRSCAVCKTLLNKLRLRESMCYRSRWIARAIGVREIKEIVVAKVIEFYIPMGFRRPLKLVPPVQIGKIVEFCLQPKKTA